MRPNWDGPWRIVYNGNRWIRPFVNNEGSRCIFLGPEIPDQTKERILAIQAKYDELWENSVGRYYEKDPNSPWRLIPRKTPLRAKSGIKFEGPNPNPNFLRHLRK